jgi:hypothetical protein
VTEAFKQRGCGQLLLKSAYTGVAASLIEGKTTHVISGISMASGRLDTEKAVTEETKKKLQTFWEGYEFLAIDEMSMTAKDFLAVLSRNISIGKQSNGNVSFGGLNVILLGDFHQFPPVARSKQDALYCPCGLETQKISSQLGRAIFEEFTMVVELKEQKRVVNPVWQAFLRRLRKGTVNRSDLAMLRMLTIGEGSRRHEDYSKPPWRDAVLVTPRHAVRTLWNEQCLRQMCRERHCPILICKAEDKVGG